MIEDGLKSAGSLVEDSNFILMSGDKRIYPATAFHDAYCAEIIAGRKQQENAYLISTLDNKKEFIISGHGLFAGRLEIMM